MIRGFQIHHQFTHSMLPKIDHLARTASFSRFNRYFLEVARHGSVRKAAEVLHVAASAVNRHLLAAEEELGVPLFERLPTGMRLTAAGELLVDMTRQWQKDYGRVLAQISDLQGLKRGHVDIAIIDALTEGFLPEAIARLTSELPLITYDIHVKDNQSLANSIITGQVDFGLMLDPESHPHLSVRFQRHIPLGIVTAPGHALSTRKAIRLNQLTGQALILPRQPLLIYEKTMALCTEMKFDTSRCLASNNIRMMRSLVRQGAGIGILSWLDVAADVEQGFLTFVPLSDSQLRPMSLSLCVASNRRLSRASAAALDYIEGRMNALEIVGH
jgi:DNA-binding transcriptional LysR family regulator